MLPVRGRMQPLWTFEKSFGFRKDAAEKDEAVLGDIENFLTVYRGDFIPRSKKAVDL